MSWTECKVLIQAGLILVVVGSIVALAILVNLPWLIKGSLTDVSPGSSL